jgi:predicted O-methyltransferase YrrM
VPYPWLHPAAVEYLEQLLQPDWWVLEHGAGGSTLWLAERVKHLVSVEHDPAWTLKVRELAPANVIIVSYLPDFESHTYDLFFIDGERMERAACLKAAHLLVKPGGWIVLDNANRPEYAEERAGLKQHAKLEARFDNNIPRSLYFVTEFYKCASV